LLVGFVHDARPSIELPRNYRKDWIVWISLPARAARMGPRAGQAPGALHAGCAPPEGRLVITLKTRTRFRIFASESVKRQATQPGKKPTQKYFFRYFSLSSGWFSNHGKFDRGARRAHTTPAGQAANLLLDTGEPQVVCDTPMVPPPKRDVPITRHGMAGAIICRPAGD